MQRVLSAVSEISITRIEEAPPSPLSLILFLASQHKSCLIVAIFHPAKQTSFGNLCCRSDEVLPQSRSVTRSHDMTSRALLEAWKNLCNSIDLPTACNKWITAVLSHKFNISLLSDLRGKFLGKTRLKPAVSSISGEPFHPKCLLYLPKPPQTLIAYLW